MSYLLLENKEKIKAEKGLAFPIEVQNFNRQKKVCGCTDELFTHLLCRNDIPTMTLILAGGIHPEVFISDLSFRLISLYQNIEKYGILFYYANNNECPEGVHQALFLIDSKIKKYEHDKMKQAQEKVKHEKGK